MPIIKFNKDSVLEHLYVYFLVTPMIARWLFPSSWELAFTIDIFGFPLFLPEISFFLLPLFKPEKISVNTNFLLISVLWFSISLISVIFSDSTTKYLNFLASFDIIITFVIFGFFPISTNRRKILKWPFLLVLLAIGFEVVFYSIGFLEKEGIGGAYTESFMRISTTIGAATGTGIIVFFVGSITYYCFYDSKYYKIFILIFTSIIILFTLSKGAIFCQVVYLFYLFLQNKIPRYVTETKLIIFMLSFVILVYGIIVLNKNFSVIDIVTQRIEEFVHTDKSMDSRSTEAREIRMNNAFNLFLEKPLLGHGSNFLVKHGRGYYIEDFDSQESYSPHNTFLLILVDYGILGLFVFIILLFYLLKRPKSKEGALYLVLYLSIVFLMNIEIVFLTMYYIMPVVLISELLYTKKDNC